MANTDNSTAVPAALPKGLRDLDGDSIVRRREAIGVVEEVYRMHGFAPLETPALEYSDAIGAFLPDDAAGTGGVFALRDQDTSALALRYDMTAPLARHVAQHRNELVFPFRRYAVGPVWRDEKPGPGRYREFWQCDADTVGAAAGAADAEMCATLAAVFVGLALPGDGYEIRISNRKVLDGVMERAGLAGEGEEDERTRMSVFRAVDKLDRLGQWGVQALLGSGRRDESGDFAPGAGLSQEQAARVLGFVTGGGPDSASTVRALRETVGSSKTGNIGVDEIERILDVLDAFPCGSGAARVDPSIVRGLAYYTGPVFEAQLTFEIRDSSGRARQFGSVAGGGRYDRLIRRFGGEDVPATGVSLGVDRLISALDAVRDSSGARAGGPVVVLSMGDEFAHQRAAAELRGAGMAAEVYAGSGGMRRQMRYADRRGSPVVVIEGDMEREAGTVQVKDLLLGDRLAKDLDTHAAWKQHPAQQTVPRSGLVECVRQILDRQNSDEGSPKP